MSELLFYRKIVPIDKAKHRDLKIGEIKEYRFAGKINSVPLAAIEFFDAAKEYPIVFAATADNQFMPAALLGLRANENLFLQKNGAWDGRYIPAFIRRYPFVLAEAGPDQMVVCIDEEHPSVGAPKGHALFEANGEPTPYLTNAMNFMHEFQAEAMRNREFVTRIQGLGLLREVEARADMKTGGTYQLSGLSVVDEAKYRELDKDTVEEFFRKGWLALIDAHLLSLGNLGRLVDKLAQVKIA